MATQDNASQEKAGSPAKAPTGSSILKKIATSQLRKDIPEFRVGDSIRVHARIVEGTKERVQLFEGVVIKLHRAKTTSATFTVRKVSYNVGVERTFFLHSPRVEKIEVTASGKVRRSKLFYLRELRGKKAKIEEQYGALLAGEPTAEATEKAAGKAAKAKADDAVAAEA